ncbi:hypothetical protein Marky_1298 [Marinithermus hydrothermalis DSM 14884]|uniref:Uncharacterized protein n=2 Tax=Marinithermus TaxID=186191 RepID=F2NK66_MARHT|nr:hypothetical protein Marky_1298 [Marinithermus hydrothermalis DSM 14884]
MAQAIRSQMEMSVVFPFAVALFGLYNTAVVDWELTKPGSRVCPKCAYTRMVLGTVLAAWGAYEGVRRLGA